MKARIRVVHHKNKTASHYPEIFFGEEWINISRYKPLIHLPPECHFATAREANEALDSFFYKPPEEEILEYKPNQIRYAVYGVGCHEPSVIGQSSSYLQGENNG